MIATRRCMHCLHARTVEQGPLGRWLPYACPPCLARLDQTERLRQEQPHNTSRRGPR